MICKLCGTESHLPNCPKCGMPMAIPTAQARPQNPQYAPQRPAQPQNPQYAPQRPAQPQDPQYAPQRPAQPQNPQYAPQRPAQPQDPQYAPQRPAQPQNPQYAPQRPAQPQDPQYAPQRPAQPQNPQYAPQRPAPKQPPYTPARPGAHATSALPVVNRDLANRKPPEQPLRFKKIVWPALCLLLPLLYLVLELFSVLTGAFADGTLIAEMFGDLTGGFFDSVSIRDIADSLAPDGGSFYSRISALTLLRGALSGGLAYGVPFLLSFGVVALLVAGCVIASIGLLITSGRALRSSFFNSLLAVCGTGAVFAPLAGMLTLRLSLACTQGLSAADAAMRGVTPTLEALMLMLILCCVLLPSLAALRKLSAKANGREDYPLFPYRSAAKCSFGALKGMALPTLALALLLPVIFFALPITTNGSLLEFCKTMAGDGGLLLWCKQIAKDVMALFGNQASSVGVYDFIAVVQSLGGALALAVTACAILHGLITLLRVALMKEDTPSHTKSAKRLLRSVGKRARGPVMSLFVCHVLCHVLLTVTVLFCSPLLTHLDFSNVEETLGAVYLVIFYLKNCFDLTTVFSLMGVLAAFLWHNTKQMTLAMVVRTGKKTKTF